MPLSTFQRVVVIAALLGAFSVAETWHVPASHRRTHRGPLAAGDPFDADEQQRRQPAPIYASSVPQNLRAQELFRGQPWRGQDGRRDSVAAIMARARAERPYTGPIRLAGRPGENDETPEPKLTNPEAPLAAQWPMTSPAAAMSLGPFAASTISTSWLGPQVSESGFVPPDSNGAVGPTQVIVSANGRIKLFDKSGTLQGLDTTDGTFFASVAGGAGVSDPHVRYDRLSGRWFITDITTTAPNRILIAVSSGSTITNASSFSFFQFQHDLVGTTPNADTGGFADYDTLGVDANALYIGVNEFTGATSSSSFIGTSGYVVKKSDLLANTLTVTAFRQLSPATGAGVDTPQGVDNDDPSAAEGYFIGVDHASFGLLQLRRVSNPGGTPAISGNLSVTVPATSTPRAQVAQGSTRALDGLDDRLFAAMIKKNVLNGVSSLWTAHAVRVNSSGVASGSGDRNAARWYQLDNLTTTPTLTQSGTVFDTSLSSPLGYWIPSVAASGQGHMTLASSYAGAAAFAGIYIAGRLSSDTLGTTQAGSSIAGVGAYNLQSSTTQRWGDYSQVVVDPTDNQTMWTFQEYTNATNSWGVRVVKVLAPPPATPVSAWSSHCGNSVNFTITGTTTGGSAFFDPGPGFANRISASISGGVTVNSTSFVSPTAVVVSVSMNGATAGPKNITITNPDGQQATANGISVVEGPAVCSVSPNAGGTRGQTAVTIMGADFSVSATSVAFGGSPASNIVVDSSSSLRAVTPASSAGAIAVSVTTPNGTGALAGGFTYFPLIFTDDPLQASITPIKAVHITELRGYIDALRTRYGVTPFAWTDTSLTAGVTGIKAQHVSELQTALSAAYVASGRLAPTFTAVSAGTAITAAQLVEIRNAIVAIY